MNIEQLDRFQRIHEQVRQKMGTQAASKPKQSDIASLIEGKKNEFFGTPGVNKNPRATENIKSGVQPLRARSTELPPAPIPAGYRPRMNPSVPVASRHLGSLLDVRA
jgi:hypothetical protein